MGKLKKSTKRFTKKHLSKTIEKRKVRQKITRTKKRNEIAGGDDVVIASQGDSGYGDDRLMTGADVLVQGKGKRKEEVVEKEEEVDFGLGELPNEPLEEEDTVEDFFSKAVDRVESDIPGGKKVKAKKKRSKKTKGKGEDAEDDTLETAEEHQKELQELAEADPEFYSFIKKSDASLLDFEVPSDDEKDNVDHEGDDDDDDDDDEKGRKKIGGAQVITSKDVEKWNASLRPGVSFNVLRKVLRALFSMTKPVNKRQKRSSDEENAKKKKNIPPPVVLASEDVGAQLLQLVLEKIPAVLDHALSEEAKGAPIISRTFVIVVTRIMLSDVVEKDALASLIQGFSAFIPLLKRRVFRAFDKILVRTIVDLLSNENENVRIASFFLAKEFSVAHGRRFLDVLLKRSFLGFVRNAKFFSSRTLEVMNFFANSVVEMFGWDEDSAYRILFVFLREAAGFLRGVARQKDSSGIDRIANFQFLHSIRLLGLVIAQWGVKELYFPLIELSLTALNLLESPRLIPSRLVLLSCVLGVARRGDLIVPAIPHMLVSSLEVVIRMRNAKTEGGRQNDRILSLRVRLSKAELRSRTVQNEIFEEIILLLTTFSAQSTHLIAFPEIITPVATALKRRVIRKHMLQDSLMERKVRILVDKMLEDAAKAHKKRKPVGFAPKDLVAVEEFENGLREQKWGLQRLLDREIAWKQKKEKDDIEIAASFEVEDEKTKKKSGPNKNHQKKRLREETPVEVEDEDEVEMEVEVEKKKKKNVKGSLSQSKKRKQRKVSEAADEEEVEELGWSDEDD
eukprot:TRINITY_DN669_c0_g1_i4.p1 TRINITY_DN669_c0_g1~~TRINITY_DN669_c0_g1_i4.p1  ORF type:complete len:839 (+),score=346.91 TRINITY_DN669_c0_g1_i4:144-2519(+)